MAATEDPAMTALSREVMQAFDDLHGVHAGFRPAHAKGILVDGVFTPSPQASTLTRAPHVQRPSTPVTVRFSDFAGVPHVADNSGDASPRGIAIRFHLAEHVHTDIVAHSFDGFPTRTAPEFVEFLRAVAASGPTAPKPTPIEQFLGSHPAALAFVQGAKPFPTSFATESYFAVNAYTFTNQAGVRQHGRYRIRPAGGTAYLEDGGAAAQSADYLLDELAVRLAAGPATFDVVVQVAASGDVVDDSTVRWPEERAEVGFGTIVLTRVTADNEAEQRRIIFDPIPRVDGIDPSGDPLTEPRAAVYLLTGRRRRAGATS